MLSLRFPLDTSPALRRTVLITHVLATGAVWFSSLPIAIKLAASALIVASHAYERARLSASPVAPVLCYDEVSGWFVAGRDGERESLEILGSTVVTPWVVVVHAQGRSAQYAWPLCRSALNADDFRRLRVCLTVGPVKGRSWTRFLRDSKFPGR